MTHEVVLHGYNVKPGSLQLGTFDSYGIEKIHVTADDEWAGLEILAVFHAPGGTSTKVVVGADGMLAVPSEATAKQAGNGRIVFVGLTENVQRITVDMGYNIKPHSDIEGDNPGTPTPDVVQQILANSNNAVSIATAAQNAAENARQAAEDAAKKAGDGAGGAAASAAAAKKSAEDAAASSESAAGKAEAAKSSANTANESAKAAQAAQGSAENAAQTAADAAGAARQAAGVAVKSAEAAETAKQRAEDAAKKALEAKTGSENALQDADAAKDAASRYADAAAKSATAVADSEKNAAKSANSAANSAAAAKKSAADADRTANSINESMMQIAANKEAVGQLKEDLANYEDALDIKLYKASLAESAPGIGLNWNLYYDMSIPAGTKVSVTLNSYSGSMFTNMSLRFFDANGNMKNYGSIKSIGGNMVITTTDDYTRLWLQINRSGIENGVNTSITFATNRSGVLKALTDLENTLNKKINEEILKASIVHTFHVEKDGTGDFTKLIDAIDEAEKYMDSVVYVGNGEWDIIDELGSDYVNSVSYTKRGIVLKNRIKLVFSSKSKVICDYSGDNTAVKNWLSPFNAGKHGFTLENLNIYSHNVRYSMHDERGSDGDFYINRYINCHFFNHNEKGGFRQCIGGGLGKNGYIVIENCVFENPKANNNSLVSYHNTANVGGGPAKSNIEVSNCYVKGSGTLRFSWYGTSTDITMVKASGNNLGSAIQFVAETSDGTSPNENVELYEWNNIIRSN